MHLQTFLVSTVSATTWNPRFFTFLVKPAFILVGQLLTTLIFYKIHLGEDSKRKNSTPHDVGMIIGHIPMTYLTLSIWYSALFHQLIASLAYPGFLNERRCGGTKSLVAGGHCGSGGKSPSRRILGAWGRSPQHLAIFAIFQ